MRVTQGYGRVSGGSFSFDATTQLGTDPNAATVLSRSGNGTAPRSSITVQGNHPTASFFIANAQGKQQIQCLTIRPTGIFTFDFDSPQENLYVYSDTQGAQLTIIEGNNL